GGPTRLAESTPPTETAGASRTFKAHPSVPSQLSATYFSPGRRRRIFSHLPRSAAGLASRSIAMRWTRLEPLASPLLMTAVAVLVVNDGVLKPAFHNALTGKLSDVAGVAAFAL